MTKIDEKLVSKLEKLSKLKIEEEDREKIMSDLNAIVQMFDKLNELDTEGVEPLRHISEAINVRRTDKVSEEFNREELLSNASKVKDGFIAVPKYLKPKE